MKELTLTKIQRTTLYIYFFSLNFAVFNFYGLGSTARLTGLLYLVSISPDIARFFKTSLLKPYLRILSLFWINLTVISLVYINHYSHDYIDFSILLNIILFWVLVNHERKDPLILLKGMLSFSLGGISLALLYNAGIGVEYEGGRVSIWGDNSNGVAVRLSIAIITMIYLIISDVLSLKVWRFLFLLPLPIMLLFMIETGSRKAFIGFFAAFVFGAMLYKAKNNWYKIMLLLISGIVCVYVYHILLSSDILYSRLLMTAKEGSLGGREEIWSSILPLIKENFLFGVGKTGYHQFSVEEFGSLVSPHNVLLEVLAYTGILGLSLYLILLLKSMWQSWRTYKINGFLLPFLLLIPSWGLILGGQALEGKLVWATLAFAVSTVFSVQKNKKQLLFKN